MHYFISSQISTEKLMCTPGFIKSKLFWIISICRGLINLLIINICNFSRSLIYPWLITGGKPTPVFLASLAFLFCAINGYIQARYLTKYAHYEMSWLTHPCFVVGVLTFFTGMAINIHSDYILRSLRKPGETGYRIPRGN